MRQRPASPTAARDVYPEKSGEPMRRDPPDVLKCTRLQRRVPRACRRNRFAVRRTISLAWSSSRR
eukprot:2781851-Pleurochrysis_carterae.AAC.1